MERPKRRVSNYLNKDAEGSSDLLQKYSDYRKEHDAGSGGPPAQPSDITDIYAEADFVGGNPLRMSAQKPKPATASTENASPNKPQGPSVTSSSMFRPPSGVNPLGRSPRGIPSNNAAKAATAVSSPPPAAPVVASPAPTPQAAPSKPITRMSVTSKTFAKVDEPEETQVSPNKLVTRQSVTSEPLKAPTPPPSSAAPSRQPSVNVQPVAPPGPPVRSSLPPGPPAGSNPPRAAPPGPPSHSHAHHPPPPPGPPVSTVPGPPPASTGPRGPPPPPSIPKSLPPPPANAAGPRPPGPPIASASKPPGPPGPPLLQSAARPPGPPSVGVVPASRVSSMLVGRPMSTAVTGSALSRLIESTRKSMETAKPTDTTALQQIAVARTVVSPPTSPPLNFTVPVKSTAPPPPSNITSASDVAPSNLKRMSRRMSRVMQSRRHSDATRHSIGSASALTDEPTQEDAENHSVAIQGETPWTKSAPEENKEVDDIPLLNITAINSNSKPIVLRKLSVAPNGKVEDAKVLIDEKGEVSEFKEAEIALTKTEKKKSIIRKASVRKSKVVVVDDKIMDQLQLSNVNNSLQYLEAWESKAKAQDVNSDPASLISSVLANNGVNMEGAKEAAKLFARAKAIEKEEERNSKRKESIMRIYSKLPPIECAANKMLKFLNSGLSNDEIIEKSGGHHASRKGSVYFAALKDKEEADLDVAMNEEHFRTKKEKRNLSNLNFRELIWYKAALSMNSSTGDAKQGEDVKLRYNAYKQGIKLMKEDFGSYAFVDKWEAIQYYERKDFILRSIAIANGELKEEETSLNAEAKASDPTKSDDKNESNGDKKEESNNDHSESERKTKNIVSEEEADKIIREALLRSSEGIVDEREEDEMVAILSGERYGRILPKDSEESPRATERKSVVGERKKSVSFHHIDTDDRDKLAFSSFQDEQ